MLHKTCLGVMPCTSNSGVYGLKKWFKWNKIGTAVIKFDEIYYNTFIKSDGNYVRHHNGKGQCLRQIAPMKYYRDNDRDKEFDLNESLIYEELGYTNIHHASYTSKSTQVGKWSAGCQVIANINDFYRKLADSLKGIGRASVVSASRLSSDAVEKIRESLSKMTGKEIKLDVEEDSSLIGGVVTKIGDLVLDGSIKTQLLNMRESLKRGERV